MAYQVIVPKDVQKSLDKLPKDIRTRIGEHIVALSNNPRPFGSIKLKSYKDRYRIRVSDYRVIYRIKDWELIVLIVDVTHRQGAYKD